MNPVTVHGKRIGQVETEPYLGFSVHRDGHKSSVNLTINLRTAQCLYRVIIPSVMTYSCESWLGCTKEMMSRLEASHKKMLYSVLGMCEKTKYAACSAPGIGNVKIVSCCS